MEFKNGKMVKDAGDGDIIILDKSPYIIDDEELINLIKQNRENNKSFKYKNKQVTILEYFKSSFISKTLVRITDEK